MATLPTDDELDTMPEPTGLELAEQLMVLFEHEGLPLPPLPEAMLDDLVLIRPWLVGTREGTPGPYALDWFVRDAVKDEPPAYLLLGHDGHGVNSVAMHYYLVTGRLALFLQISWGGAYMDKAGRNAAVAAGFAAASRLIEAARRAEPELVRSDRRLVVVASDLHGHRHALLRAGEAPDWRPSGDALAAAVASLQ